MDALSDVLRLVGLTGGVFIDAEFTAPWSVSGKVAPELCRSYMVEPEYVDRITPWWRGWSCDAAQFRSSCRWFHPHVYAS